MAGAWSKVKTRPKKELQKGTTQMAIYADTTDLATVNTDEIVPLNIGGKTQFWKFLRLQELTGLGNKIVSDSGKDFTWNIGQWHSVDINGRGIYVCSHGLHASPEIRHAYDNVPSHILALVEAGGEYETASNATKFASQHMRIVRLFDLNVVNDGSFDDRIIGYVKDFYQGWNEETESWARSAMEYESAWNRLSNIDRYFTELSYYGNEETTLIDPQKKPSGEEFILKFLPELKVQSLTPDQSVVLWRDTLQEKLIEMGKELERAYSYISTLNDTHYQITRMLQTFNVPTAPMSYIPLEWIQVGKHEGEEEDNE